MPHIKNALIRYRIIDKCLRNKYKPFPSKKMLREACEESLFGSSDGEHISDSTIEKDLFAMRMELDAPIAYSALHRGYFYEDRDFSINDIPLTEDDLEAIAFAAKTLMQFRDVEFFRQFGHAIDKIVDRINVSKSDETDQFIQFEATYSDGGSEFLSTLLGAIKEQVWIHFDYASFVTGEMKRRTVTPLLLKQYRNRWYLISFDRDKNDYITYALDRMEDLELSTEKAVRPEGFNPDNYFKYAVGITSGNTPPEKVLLKASTVASKYLDSLPLHSSQKIVEMHDDGFTFGLVVNVSEELIREILSYGGAVKVLAPSSLKSEIEKRAKRLLEE